MLSLSSSCMDMEIMWDTPWNPQWVCSFMCETHTLHILSSTKYAYIFSLHKFPCSRNLLVCLYLILEYSFLYRKNELYIGILLYLFNPYHKRITNIVIKGGNRFIYMLCQINMNNKHWNLLNREDHTSWK